MLEAFVLWFMFSSYQVEPEPQIVPNWHDLQTPTLFRHSRGLDLFSSGQTYKLQ